MNRENIIQCGISGLTSHISIAHHACEGPKHIKYVALIAERHSGSTWMVNYLRAYFADKDIWITSTLCTWKVSVQVSFGSGMFVIPGKSSYPVCHKLRYVRLLAWIKKSNVSRFWHDWCRWHTLVRTFRTHSLLICFLMAL